MTFEKRGEKKSRFLWGFWMICDYLVLKVKTNLRVRPSYFQDVGQEE